MVTDQARQAGELARDLLVVVEDVGQVVVGVPRGQLGGQLQLDGHATLHIGRAASVEHVLAVFLADGGRHGAEGPLDGGQGHGVQVTGQDNAGALPLFAGQRREFGAGDDGVPITGQVQVRVGLERRVYGVGQVLLVIGYRFIVEQGTGQLGHGYVQVQGCVVIRGNSHPSTIQVGGAPHPRRRPSVRETNTCGSDARCATAHIMVCMSENTPRYASGVALVNVVVSGEHAGTVLDAWFPAPSLTQTPDLSIADELEELAAEHPARNARTEVRTASINLDEAPEDAVDAYLRLHLLSHTLVRPNELNLDGLFGALANVAWTNHGPVLAAEFQKLAIGLRKLGHLSVSHIDKFPRMVDYVVPAGVRIGDGDRLRLGAHLASGTTVMHEGFVNFNAGTLGTSMVEGRISQGVVVGDGSDVGGGASTMGTLSGGGKKRVSIGERSLLGAESGIGIALGDDCVVEAGLYVTAGSRVSVLLPGQEPHVVKAAELSGVSNLLFRRNSLSGAIEVLPRATNSVELNEALHLN